MVELYVRHNEVFDAIWHGLFTVQSLMFTVQAVDVYNACSDLLGKQWFLQTNAIVLIDRLRFYSRIHS